MALAEFEYPHLREMSVALYRGIAFKEDHPRAMAEFWQAMMDFFNYLTLTPNPINGPVERLDESEVIWRPKKLWDPDDGKLGFIRVAVDSGDDVIEMNRYPTYRNRSFREDPIIGIMISGNDYPMASIIRNRSFPVTSFTGPARTKEELAIVRSALFIPVNLKTWAKMKSREVAIINS